MPLASDPAPLVLTSLCTYIVSEIIGGSQIEHSPHAITVAVGLLDHVQALPCLCQANSGSLRRQETSSQVWDNIRSIPPKAQPPCLVPWESSRLIPLSQAQPVWIPIPEAGRSIFDSPGSLASIGLLQGKELTRAPTLHGSSAPPCGHISILSLLASQQLVPQWTTLFSVGFPAVFLVPLTPG